MMPIISSAVATGRMMKSRDGPPPLAMSLLPRLCNGRGSLSRTTTSTTNLHRRARLELVLPVGNHRFPGRDPLRNRGIVTLAEGDRYRPHLGRLVGFHSEDVCALRPALYRRSGNYRAVLAHFEQEARIHELVGPQRVVMIVEDGFQLARACLGIDLVVNGQQRPRCQLGLIVAAIRLDLQGAIL